MKAEKALIELNEIRNDIIFQKNEEKREKTADANSSFPLIGGITASSFHRTNMNGTAFKENTSSGFFNEANGMMGNMSNLTYDQMKERLLVAETMMKKLYERNKDIELYHK